MNVQPDLTANILYYELYVQNEDQVSQIVQFLKGEVSTHLRNYIWHNDVFQISACDHELNGQKHTLAGKMNLLEDSGGVDEKVVTSLIVRATQSIKGTLGRIWDSDGQYLLIECAQHVPDWLTPDVAANRVWLKDGQVVILGGEQVNSIQEAIERLRDDRNILQMDELNEAVSLYISGYLQSAAQDNIHLCRTYLPNVKLALLLHQRPQFVASIVRAFYNRTPLELKPITSMPSLSPFSPVHSNILFSKPLFAMLRLQQFTPFPCFTSLAYSLPKRIESFYELDAGIKLAVGLEIILHEAQDDTIDIRNEWNSLSSELIQEVIQTWEENKLESQSEDWLKVDPNTLGGGTTQTKEDEGDVIEDMINKVKKFMDDESAGLGGVENLNEDEEEDLEEDFEEVVFDEEEFWRTATGKAKEPQPTTDFIDEIDDDDDDGSELDEAEMKKLMDEMDADLAAANIKFNPKGKSDDSDDEVEIDAEFVRNMLESLKASGFSGPGASMLEAMNAKLPHE